MIVLRCVHVFVKFAMESWNVKYSLLNRLHNLAPVTVDLLSRVITVHKSVLLFFSSIAGFVTFKIRWKKMMKATISSLYRISNSSTYSVMGKFYP